MNTTNNELPTGLAPLKTLEMELQKATVGGKNKMNADFREAYPLIEQHLATNVSQKAAMDIFNAAYGYKLHPPRFRQMLATERERRSEAGELLICIGCGQQLPACQDVAKEVHDQEGQ